MHSSDYPHLQKKNVALPKTVFLSKNDFCVERVSQSSIPWAAADHQGTVDLVFAPVEKVMDIAGFFRVARRFIKMSDWIVVVAVRGEGWNDWRVGVLDGQLLYACRYTIPSVTFKIQASVNGHIVYCGVESMPESAVPLHVSSSGIDAANAIGRGLYGVDIKNNNGDACVIEVNDNPSLESGEDACYPHIYERIVSTFLLRDHL